MLFKTFNWTSAVWCNPIHNDNDIQVMQALLWAKMRLHLLHFALQVALQVCSISNLLKIHYLKKVCYWNFSGIFFFFISSFFPLIFFFYLICIRFFFSKLLEMAISWMEEKVNQIKPLNGNQSPQHLGNISLKAQHLAIPENWTVFFFFLYIFMQYSFHFKYEVLSLT